MRTTKTTNEPTNIVQFSRCFVCIQLHSCEHTENRVLCRATGLNVRSSSVVPSSRFDLNIPPSRGTTEAGDVQHHHHFGPQTAVCREASDAIRRGKKTSRGNYNKALFYGGRFNFDVEESPLPCGLNICLASHGMYCFEH